MLRNLISNMTNATANMTGTNNNDTFSWATSAPILINETTASTDDPRIFGFVQDTQTLAIAILVGVVCFLLIVLIAVMAPYFFPGPEPRPQQRRSRRQSIDPERVKRRYQTITEWLITKEAMEHSKACGDEYVASPCKLGPPTKAVNDDGAVTKSTATIDEEDCSSTQQHEASPGGDQDISLTAAASPRESQVDCVASFDTMDDSAFDYHRKDCHICMEEFQVGDKVSWSATGNCNHAYHFECIKEWLLKKKDCPYCRQTMLPVDDDFNDIMELVEAKNRYEAVTYFCQKDGLIVMPPTAIRRTTTSSTADTSTIDDTEADEETGFTAGIVMEEDEGQYDFEPPLGNNAIIEAPIIEDGGSTDIDDDDGDDLEAGAPVSNNV